MKHHTCDAELNVGQLYSASHVVMFLVPIVAVVAQCLKQKSSNMLKTKDMYVCQFRASGYKTLQGKKHQGFQGMLWLWVHPQKLSRNTPSIAHTNVQD